MKSPMLTAQPKLAEISNADLFAKNAVKSGYSDLQVLQSAAGFYIGTLYQEMDEDGTVLWTEPGSRDSGYFPTKEAAERELRQMEGGDLTCVRWHP